MAFIDSFLQMPWWEEPLKIIITRVIWLSMLFGVKKWDTGVSGDIWLHSESTTA